MNAAFRDGQALGQGFRLGELRVDPRAGEVSGPGGQAQLDPRVMDVLLVLAQHAGQVVLREDLLARLWPNSVVTDDALSRCIYDLRRQLARAGGSDRFRALLETVPKRGYRLAGEVTPLDSHAAAQSRRRMDWLFPVLAAMAVIAVTWFAIGRQAIDPGTGPQPPPANAPEHSIAVLPFLDLSPTQDQAYLADGIAEEILTRLAEAGNLRVIARTSSFAFRGKPADIRDIAAKLNVSHVLEGSIRRSGASIRITAQLIAASDHSHVWSESIDWDLGELFAVQDGIAASVATALQVTLDGRAPHRRMPASVEAYERYLEGHFHYNRRAPGDIERSARHFEEATAIDPRYARAWAALSGAYSLLAPQGGQAREDWRRRQGEAAHTAVDLDPRLATAHARLGRYYYQTGDLERGRAHSQQALALDPDDPLVLGFSAMQAIWRGDMAGAVSAQRRVVELDPMSFAQRNNLAHFLLATGRLDEALREFRRALELNPDDAWETGTDMARILAVQQRYDEAYSIVAGLPEGNLRDHGLAWLHDAPGRRTEANRALQRLTADPGDTEETVRLAETYAFRGRKDEALTLLQSHRTALAREKDDAASRIWRLAQNLRTSYHLAPLHSDPRWAPLIAELE
ncbi:MAG: winged helix-turn-helix domain-containing tetratricopeptide repeat protein [Steroidobacteraceae bacterium]